MKLKGWKKLGRVINKIGKEIEPKLHYELSSLDQSSPSEKLVYFGILRTVDDDIMFMEHLNKVHTNAPILSTFIYSLLHEIGHYHTRKILNAEPHELRNKANAANDNCVTYFALPSEIAATAWAVEYARQHFCMLEVLQEKIEDKMHDFLRDNNLCI
jgi:hypothetical protein